MLSIRICPTIKLGEKTQQCKYDVTITKAVDAFKQEMYPAP